MLVLYQEVREGAGCHWRLAHQEMRNDECGMMNRKGKWLAHAVHSMADGSFAALTLWLLAR